MKRDVYWWFQRAMARHSTPEPDNTRQPVTDMHGNSAVFSFTLADDNIRDVAYRCTTCCTLVGLCEHLSVILLDLSLAEARKLSKEWLLALHPEVPASHHERAHLAVAAVLAALPDEGAFV